MITKEDYKEYFTSILKVEERMVANLENNISKIVDREIKDFFSKKIIQEQAHVVLAKKLLKILEE